jgi:hypothetical protein
MANNQKSYRRQYSKHPFTYTIPWPTFNGPAVPAACCLVSHHSGGVKSVNGMEKSPLMIMLLGQGGGGGGDGDAVTVGVTVVGGTGRIYRTCICNSSEECHCRCEAMIAATQVEGVILLEEEFEVPVLALEDGILEPGEDVEISI